MKNTEKRVLLADDDQHFREDFFRDHKEKYLINVIPYKWAMQHCKTQNYDLLLIQDPEANTQEEVVYMLSTIRALKPTLKILVMPGPHITFDIARSIDVKLLTKEDFIIQGHCFEDLIDKQLWPHLNSFEIYKGT